MNATDQQLRLWLSAKPLFTRLEQTGYDVGSGRWIAKLEENGRTVATGRARGRDEAIALAVAGLPADEPRANRRRIDPVTELAAAKAWLAQLAIDDAGEGARAAAVLEILAGKLLASRAPRTVSWLQIRAQSGDATHKRWARAILAALEMPRNLRAVQSGDS